MRDSTGARAFRRTGTTVFGASAMVFVMSFCVWSLTDVQVRQTWFDYAFGGAIFGTISCFVFRVGVWPAVVLRPKAVVVQNPLVDYLLTGGSPRMVQNALSGIAVGDGGVQVPVFALSSSILDRVTGSRTTHRLLRALESREAAAGPVVVRRDRIRVLRQASAFAAAGAIVGVLAHLAESLR